MVNEWVSVLAQFLQNKIWCIYYSCAHFLANITLNLIRSTYSKSFLAANHQLSYFLQFCQFKLAQQLENIALQSVVLMLLCLPGTSKIRK